MQAGAALGRNHTRNKAVEAMIFMVQFRHLFFGFFVGMVHEPDLPESDAEQELRALIRERVESVN
jgi:hypothetical protein